MTDRTDHNPAGAVREEDAFDVEAVTAWLREHATDATGLDGTPDVRQFAGGASNLTYRLDWSSGRSLILRRPPSGRKAKGAHDMGREHRIQSRLIPVFPYVPEMVAFCDDESVIGSEFYVMERLPGTILRAELVLPDEPARQAVALKLHDRAAYEAEMRRTATRLKERTG